MTTLFVLLFLLIVKVGPILLAVVFFLWACLMIGRALN
jgi:hypothetical protein